MDLRLRKLIYCDSRQKSLYRLSSKWQNGAIIELYYMLFIRFLNQASTRCSRNIGRPPASSPGNISLRSYNCYRGEARNSLLTLHVGVHIGWRSFSCRTRHCYSIYANNIISESDTCPMVLIVPPWRIVRIIVWWVVVEFNFEKLELNSVAIELKNKFLKLNSIGSMDKVFTDDGRDVLSWLASTLRFHVKRLR